MLLAGNKTGSNAVTGGLAVLEVAILSKGAALDCAADPVGDSSLILLAKQ